MSTVTIPDLERIAANLALYHSGVPEPLLDNAGADTDDLLAYARACRTLLQGLEWSSKEECRNKPGSTEGVCPECLERARHAWEENGGFYPTDGNVGPALPGSHAPDCALAALIGAPTR